MVHTCTIQAGVHSTLIFVDETCFNEHIRRTRDRAPRGQPAYRQVCSRGPNLNLVMAINEDVGVVYYELERGTMTGEKFQYFLDNLEEAIGDFTATIVLDNATVHKGATIRKEMHAIQFLPAYSPFLNPIENAFSCLKAAIKAEIRERMQDLVAPQPAPAVSLATHRLQILRDIGTRLIEDRHTISPVKCANMVRHVLTYMAPCLARDNILF